MPRADLTLAFLVGAFVGTFYRMDQFPASNRLGNSHVSYNRLRSLSQDGANDKCPCDCMALKTQLQSVTGLLGECLQIDNSNLRSEGLQSEKADAHAARFKTLKNEAISMIAPVSHQATVKRSPRKVYVDLGANDGQSVAFFVLNDTSHRFDGNHQGGEKDSIFLGMGGSKDWDVVVVEANTRYTPLLEAQREAFLNQSLVKSYKLLSGTAVAAFDGNITFRLDLEGGDAGATTNLESGSAVGWDRNVTAIDIVTLLQEEDLQEGDTVAIKMDVEGAEFEIVRRLIMSGMHSRVTMLGVEWHHTNEFVLLGREKYVEEFQCLQWLWDRETSMQRVAWE